MSSHETPPRLGGRCILRQNEVVAAGADRQDGGGDGLADPGRILIYGVTGSGKTTLAKQIGEITGLPALTPDPVS